MTTATPKDITILFAGMMVFMPIRRDERLVALDVGIVRSEEPPGSQLRHEFEIATRDLVPGSRIRLLRPPADNGITQQLNLKVSQPYSGSSEIRLLLGRTFNRFDSENDNDPQDYRWLINMRELIPRNPPPDNTRFSHVLRFVNGEVFCDQRVTAQRKPADANDWDNAQLAFIMGIRLKLTGDAALVDQTTMEPVFTLPAGGNYLVVITNLPEQPPPVSDFKDIYRVFPLRRSETAFDFDARLRTNGAAQSRASAIYNQFNRRIRLGRSFPRLSGLGGGTGRALEVSPRYLCISVGTGEP